MVHRDHAAQESNFAISPARAVLLVNKDRDDLHYYSTILQRYGFHVWGCESYEEGTRLLDSVCFDFIIVSQGGPNFEGRCIVECANQIDRRMPVLVMARSLEMPCYLEAMQLGAVDYLAEPVSLQELGRTVETHLRPRVSEPEQSRASRRLESAREPPLVRAVSKALRAGMSEPPNAKPE
jgi:DNA-binding NtrC family response regulator